MFALNLENFNCHIHCCVSKVTFEHFNMNSTMFMASDFVTSVETKTELKTHV